MVGDGFASYASALELAEVFKEPSAQERCQAETSSFQVKLSGRSSSAHGFSKEQNSGGSCSLPD